MKLSKLLHVISSYMAKYPTLLILVGSHIGFMQVRVKGGNLSLCPHFKCLISSLSVPKGMFVLKNAGLNGLTTHMPQFFPLDGP